MVNRVSGELSTSNLTSIDKALATLYSQLPFLVELSPVESKRLTRMETNRVDFVNKALSTGLTNEQLRPQFFDIAEMQKDINLCAELDRLLGKIDMLYKQVSDTRDQAGHEAYLSALEVYNTAKRASTRGIPGAQTAFEELRTMFEGQRKLDKTATDNTPPTTA
jgi:hypothetical protein